MQFVAKYAIYGPTCFSKLYLGRLLKYKTDNSIYQES